MRVLGVDPGLTRMGVGVVMVAAARRGLPVTMHTPSEVKAAITGDGRAQKEQVAAMVVRLLKLAEAPKPVDALEDSDDVQNVYANFDVSDEVMAKLDEE